MSNIIAALATDAHPRQVLFDDSAQDLLRQFFGRDLSHVELANLVGALDESALFVEGRGDRVLVQIKHRKLKTHDVIIAHTAAGKVFVRIDELEFAAFHRGQREGVKMLLRQITQARKLGVAYLEAEADGNAKTFARRNGFYVWARFGFDAPLAQTKTAALPQRLKFIEGREARTLNDLMLRDGQSWWRANGAECLTFFDLRDNSNSLRVLEKYLLELRQEDKL